MLGRRMVPVVLHRRLVLALMVMRLAEMLML